MRDKRLLRGLAIVMAALIACLCMSACGSTEPEKENYAVGEVAAFEDVEYTVTNVSFNNGGEWDVLEDGKQFVIITVQIDNKSEDKIDFNELDWQIVNANGEETDITYSTTTGEELSSGSLNKGGVKTGNLCFEVPTEGSLLLHYYSNMFNEEYDLEFVIR